MSHFCLPFSDGLDTLDRGWTANRVVKWLKARIVSLHREARKFVVKLGLVLGPARVERASVNTVDKCQKRYIIASVPWTHSYPLMHRVDTVSNRREA